MERMQLLPALLIISAALFFTSCKPSRVWATKEKKQEDRMVRNTPAPPPPPRYYNSVSAALIISPSPGFVMNSSPDGRYYHRSPSGLLYWKGYDNRFFLDRGYLNRVRFSQWEYDQWKRYSGER